MYDVDNPNYVIELRYNNFRQKGTEKEIEALKGTKTKEWKAERLLVNVHL